MITALQTLLITNLGKCCHHPSTKKIKEIKTTVSFINACQTHSTCRIYCETNHHETLKTPDHKSAVLHSEMCSVTDNILNLKTHTHSCINSLKERRARNRNWYWCIHTAKMNQWMEDGVYKSFFSSQKWFLVEDEHGHPHRVQSTQPTWTAINLTPFSPEIDTIRSDHVTKCL